jgi:hypothetical protein
MYSCLKPDESFRLTLYKWYNIYEQSIVNFLFLIGSLTVNTNVVLSSFSPTVVPPGVPNSFRAKVFKQTLI